MKNLNVLETLNTESGKSMAATATGGLLGAVIFYGAKEAIKEAMVLGKKLKGKLQSKKQKTEAPAVVETAEE